MLCKITLTHTLLPLYYHSQHPLTCSPDQSKHLNMVKHIIRLLDSYLFSFFFLQNPDLTCVSINTTLFVFMNRVNLDLCPLPSCIVSALFCRVSCHILCYFYPDKYKTIVGRKRESSSKFYNRGKKLLLFTTEAFYEKPKITESTGFGPLSI